MNQHDVSYHIYSFSFLSSWCWLQRTSWLVTVLFLTGKSSHWDGRNLIVSLFSSPDTVLHFIGYMLRLILIYFEPLTGYDIEDHNNVVPARPHSDTVPPAVAAGLGHYPAPDSSKNSKYKSQQSKASPSMLLNSHTLLLTSFGFLISCIWFYLYVVWSFICMGLWQYMINSAHIMFYMLILEQHSFPCSIV